MFLQASSARSTEKDDRCSGIGNSTSLAMKYVIRRTTPKDRAAEDIARKCRTLADHEVNAFEAAQRPAPTAR